MLRIEFNFSRHSFSSLKEHCLFLINEFRVS
nr:MAG TPA: hypothetical protein [Caudoviricetes sp.]